MNEIIPRVGQQKLASFCDAFVERGGFTPEEARRILEAGRAAGMRPRLHVDQLGDGGGAELDGPADLVVFGCKSYTHLPYHLAINHVRWVVKGGDVVVQREKDVPVCE